MQVCPGHPLPFIFARTWLAAQDLEVTDPDVLFKLLDDGDKQLTAEALKQSRHFVSPVVLLFGGQLLADQLRKSWSGEWIA